MTHDALPEGPAKTDWWELFYCATDKWCCPVHADFWHTSLNAGRGVRSYGDSRFQWLKKKMSVCSKLRTTPWTRIQIRSGETEWLAYGLLFWACTFTGNHFLCFLITRALNPSKCVRTCENFCNTETKTVAKMYQKSSERWSSCW